MEHQTHCGDGSYDATGHLDETEYREPVSAVQRRAALELISRSVLPIEIEELATMIVAGGNESIPVDSEAIDRVTRRLHHLHLPKMAALGVVGYDTVNKRIESSP